MSGPPAGGPPSSGPPPGGPPPGGGKFAPVPPAVARAALLYFTRYLRPMWGLLIIIGACSVITALVPLPMTFLPAVLTYRVEIQDYDYVKWYLGFVLATFVVGWIVNLIFAWVNSQLGEQFAVTVRSQAFNNLERLSMLSVYSKGPGEFAQQLGRDVFVVRDLLTMTLFRNAIEIMQGTAVLASLFILKPTLTCILLLGFLATVGPVLWINRRLGGLASEGRELAQQLMTWLVENIGGFRDIVASGRFQRTSAKYTEYLDESRRINVKLSVLGQLSGLIPSMALSLGLWVVYASIVVYHIPLKDVGQVITYTSLLSQLFPTVMSMTGLSTTITLAGPSLLALRKVLELPPPAAGIALSEPIRQLSFDHVTLEMDGRRILDDVTFEIPAGKLTAIVGQSGAGKTTLFHMLLRLIEPSSGAVLINGRPSTDYALESLRDKVGFIPQNPFIFNLSLRENICISAPGDVSPELLNAAVGIAQLDAVIERRRSQGGLEAIAGYLGQRLSGGEKQRIALARIALRTPEIIVCDEYTANVDVATARVIHETMRTHFAGKTRVLITHELYLSQGADQVVVVEQGRVVQQGTHDELLRQPGLYREMWSLHHPDEA